MNNRIENILLKQYSLIILKNKLCKYKKMVLIWVNLLLKRLNFNTENLLIKKNHQKTTITTTTII